MQLDVAYLRDFYASPLGLVVRRLLASRIRGRWRRLEQETLIGLGFAAPYLGGYRGEVRRLGAMMPAAQGALVWPASGPTTVVLVDEERLPLPDNSVDRLLVVHCLEVAARPETLLREIWRVLTPQGRLLAVVPNRRGLWSRLDTTPFGQGRPFSRPQLEHLLNGALLTPLEWSGALYVPPFDRRLLLKTSATWERVGRRLSTAFAGVLVVEATKEIAAPAGRRVRARVLPELVVVRPRPAAAGRGAGRLTLAASAGSSSRTRPSLRAGSALKARS